MARSPFCKPIPLNTVVGLSRPVAQDTSQTLNAQSMYPTPYSPPFTQPFIIGTHAGAPTAADGVKPGYGYIDTNGVGYVCTATNTYVEVVL